MGPSIYEVELFPLLSILQPKLVELKNETLKRIIIDTVMREA